MKKAIIILHKIYGINSFIKEQCKKYTEAGLMCIALICLAGSNSLIMKQNRLTNIHLD